MVYTFDKKNANAPSTHKTQYFEMMGDHAIYHDGWIASTKVMRPPWDICGGVGVGSGELPVGALRPAQRLDAVGRRGREEPGQAEGDAGPLLAGGGEVPGAAARRDGGDAAHHAAPEHHGGPQRVHLDGAAHRHAERRRAELLNASYNFKAEIEVPQGGGEGMLITQGGRFGGYGFYLLKGKPVFTWNLVDLERIKWEGPGRARARQAHARVRLQVRRPRHGHAGVQQHERHRPVRHRRAQGRRQGRRRAEDGGHVPFILQWDENLDVGSDTGTPVDDKDYQVPFAFTGKIDKITLTIDRPKLTPEDEKKLMQAQRNNKASE